MHALPCVQLRLLTVGDDSAWLQSLHCNVTDEAYARVEALDQVVSTILEPDTPQTIVYTTPAAAELKAVNLQNEHASSFAR